ncbi:MAG: HAD family hydrolase [Thermococci archaeon]|nr:HAD family hydrolase [Thermococci archaeon]
MLVIVDLDDTLCNTWEAGRKAIVRMAFELILRFKLRAISYLLFSRYRHLEKERSLHLLDLRGITERVLEDIYGSVNPDFLADIHRIIDRVFFSNLRLYPDARPFLEGIKRMGAKIALVTDSSSKWQRKKLEHLGIREYFDMIVISGETGHTKFEPYNFRLVVNRLSDGSVYVVGDRDDTDMMGAKCIGATGILVKRGYFRMKKAKNADYTVKNLNEALNVIKKLEDR